MPALTGNLYQMADTNKISNSDLIPVIRQKEEKPQTDTRQVVQDERTGLINPQSQTYTGNNNIGDFLWVAQIWRGSDYVFSPSEARAIETLAATSENPGESVGKFIASQAISSRTGYDIGTVYQNLNELSKFYSGKDYAPNDSTFAEKFTASFKLIDSQRLKKQWQEAFLFGDNEKAAQLKEQIDALDAEIGDVLNGVPQNLLDQIANVVIGNAGYIWNTIQTGAEWAMASTAVLTPLTYLAGLNPIAAAAAAGSIGLFSGAAAAIGSFMEVSSLSEAETFYEMMNSGETQNVTSAQIFSKLNGLFVGATEIFLDGIVSRGLSKVAGKTIDNFGLSLLVDYVGQGTARKFSKPVLDWVTGALDEAFLNEFPQSIFESLMNAAYKHSLGQEFEIDFNQMMSDGLQAAADGFLVGLVYGGLGVPFEMREFRDTSLSLRREANVTPSREMFFDKTEKLKPETVSQEVFNEARDKIFTAARQQQADYMAQNYAGTVLESQEIAESELFAQVDEEGNPVGTPDGSVNRTPQGRLYAEERVNNGTTTVYFGDRENGSIYGSVEFSQTEDKVKVTGVRVSPGYENMRAEMLQQTFADYGFNKEIEWNPTTPGLQSVKQSLIDSNPDKTGLNFRSSSVKANTQAMADTIQKAMPNLSRPEAIVSASLYSLADRNKILSSLNNGQIFGDAAADGIELTGNRGAVNLAKGLIYAGQNADVSTFTHELFHAVAAARPVERKSLSSAIREEAQNENSTLASFLEDHREIWGDSFNIDQILNDFRNLSDNWTVSQDENVARLYEAYRSSKASQRKTLPQKIRAVLDRLADFINRVYTDLRDSVQLNENIAKAFDRITGIEKPSTSSSPSGNGIRYQDNKVRVKGVDSEESAYKKARPMVSQFNDLVNEMVETIGLDTSIVYEGFKNEDFAHPVIMRNGLKTHATARRKFLAETHDWSTITDLYGGTFVFPTKEDVKAAYETLKEKYADRIVKSKQLTNAGYEDYKLSFRMPNGAIFELILLDVDTNWMKMEGSGHLIYEITRELDPMIDIVDNQDAKTYLSDLFEHLRKLQEIEYSLAKEARLGYQEYEGSLARFNAISALISFLHTGTDNSLFSDWVGSLSNILPSESTSTRKVWIPDELQSLINGVSSISKYLSESGIVPPDFNIQENQIYANKEFIETENKLETNLANFNEDGEPLAPNGEVSNLDYHRWVAVRMPSFKKWAGDWENDPQNATKVIDENGEPKIVYHGTNNREKKRVGRYPDGTWKYDYPEFSVFRGTNFFNSDEDNAGGYGSTVYTVFLNLRNPLIIDANGQNYSYIKFNNEFHDTYEIAEYAKSNGYDGVIFNDLYDGVDYGALQEKTNDYVTFKPNQIKSIDNTGSFDSYNPDIRFQSAYHGSGADFNHFDLSFLSTGAGDQVFGRGVYVTQSEAIARNYAELAYTEDKRKDDISHYEKLIAGKEAELDQFDKDRADSEKMAQLKDEDKQRIERFYKRRIDEGKPVNELLQAKYKVSTWEEIEQKRLDAIAVYPEAYSDSKRDSIVKEIDRYRTELEKVKQKDPQSRNLYSVTIPDSGYLVWEKKVPVAAAEKIAKALNADEYDRADIINYFRNSGEEMYSYLERQFSYDAKRVADFLSSVGFVGISYPAGTRVALPDGTDPRTRNFVIFNENDVLIDDHIRYQRDPDNPDRFRFSGMFYRKPEDITDQQAKNADPSTVEEAVDAVDYFSPEDPAAFVEYDGPEFTDDELVELGAIPEEPSVDYRSLTPADQLGYTYEEAVASVNPDIVYEGSESAKDRIFADAVNNEENFNRYMFILGENLNLNSNDKNGYIQGGRKYIDPYTDQNRREKLQAMTRARVSDLDVRNVASAINLGNQADERRIVAARKEIIDNARIYRDLFADLTGDKNMKPKTLIEGRLNISSSEGETYRSIDELAKIAADASFSEIERKLRNGSLKMKDIDDSMLSRISVTISRIKREYDNAEKANAALKEQISTLESETSEARKKQQELNNAVRKTIDELNKNVSSQQRKAINPEYAAMAKELRDIKSRDAFIQDEMPADGRSARGRKVLYRAREAGDQKWRAYLLKEYGLSDLRAIHKREKELEALMPDENIAHLRQLASQVSKNVAAAEKQIIDMKKELAGFGASSAKTALASNLDSLGTSIKSQKDAAVQIRNKHIPTEGDIDTLINLNRAITEDYENKISSIKKNYEKLLNEQKERREKLIHAQGQREALRQIKAEKAKYARSIMEPVNLQTTDWETGGQAIMAIQAMIDPQFRRDWTYALDVNLEGETGGATMTIPEAIEYFNSLDDAGRQAVAQVISPQLLARLTGQRKPLNDWTVQELRQMAREVDDLRRLGRQTLTAKNAFLRNQAKYIVKDILANIEELGRTERKNIPNSQEFKTHRRNITAKINQVIYSTRRPQELAQLLDGGYGSFGPAYNLLVDEKRFHQNRATKAINERLDKIVPMVTKDVAAALAKTVNIDFGDGHAATFTMDDLGYIYLSQYEEKNRAAVAFGMLVTQEEKGTGIPKGLDADGNIQKEYISSNVIANDDVLENVGWSRYNKALSVATLSLQEAGLMPLIDAIKNDFAGQGKRLQKMMIDVYNTPISLVEHYLPIKRSDLTGEDMAAEFADSVFNTNNSGIMYNPEKGFTVKRVSIPPRQQKPIRSSLLSIWKQSVQQQEWLIENAAYQKKLHRVFLNSELSNAIGSAYTPDLYQEIEDYINLLANPFRGERKTAAEMAVKNLRGNLAAAYLGWKASGIVLQALTSPFPFLSDVSLPRLIKAYIELSSGAGALEQIYEKSVMMKNRSMNPIVEELIQRANNAGSGKLKNLLYDFQQKGMFGLEMVDRIAVAGGWLAQYQQTLDTKLSQGLSTAEAEAAAIKAADDLVLKVQPVGDKTELASMFRTNNEYAKAILQFQTSLNVIWNNITADIQGYARNKEFRKIAGTLAGYGIAGILVGAVMTGFDDDDDPVEKARDVGFWMLTQFTDSVPWVGSTVTDVFQKAITGKVDYYGNSSIFPAFNKLASAIEAGVDFNWTKALNYLGQAIGYVTGVPVSGMKQIINAITEGDVGKLIGR